MEDLFMIIQPKMKSLLNFLKRMRLFRDEGDEIKNKHYQIIYPLITPIDNNLEQYKIYANNQM